MKLTEIAIDNQEPLLIILLRKLLKQENTRVWVQGSFSKLQVKGIGEYVVDQPKMHDRDEYHGKCYDIKVHHGVGLGITPPEAETDWELVKMSESPRWIERDMQTWELRRVKR